MMLKLRMRMPIMAAPRVWADYLQNATKARRFRTKASQLPLSKKNSSGRMLQWMLRLFPIGLEPQSLIRCSEVEGIDRRWQTTAI